MKYATTFLPMFFAIFISSATAQQVAQADISETKMQFEIMAAKATALGEHAREFIKIERKLTLEKGRAFYIETVGGEQQAAVVEVWMRDLQYGLGTKLSVIAVMMEMIENEKEGPGLTKYFHEFAIALTQKTPRELIDRALKLAKEDLTSLEQRKPVLPQSKEQ